MRFIIRYRVLAPPVGTSYEFNMVLDEYAILKNGERSPPDDLIAFENRTMENNILRLPLARFSADINQGNRPAVERSALAVGIGLVIVGIKNLHLIVCH